ncbi:MAG TPA: SGNH/GDSL hydrolase family protein [Phycisphaerae bacterium]|nr:SGNH/GDSL hydrolase family protein [Phycisphaerae bacterium]
MLDTLRLRAALGCTLAALAGALAGCSRHVTIGPADVQEAVVTIPPTTDPSLDWVDARTLTIEGKGWEDTPTAYDRLPVEAEETVTPAVWSLSHDSAGIAIRFVTDSPRLAAQWNGGGGMNHMAATGNSGLDLYQKTADGWVFRGVGKPDTQHTTRVLSTSGPREPTEYLLYLPLYNPVTDLRIGIDRGSKIEPALARPAARKPLVFYGTSITQGGCASRTGMCHTAILGRWFDREVINLGFSGAGKMEMAMAELLGELDPAAYVLECLPNMTTDMVRDRVKSFVRYLRATHLDTPIVLVENPHNPDNNPGNVALRDAYALLRAEGTANLYLLPGARQLAGPENGTVDGVHPTDLGFLRMAEAYVPTLEEVLKEPAHIPAD